MVFLYQLYILGLTVDFLELLQDKKKSRIGLGGIILLQDSSISIK
jgi:hypothetical protein